MIASGDKTITERASEVKPIIRRESKNKMENYEACVTSQAAFLSSKSALHFKYHKTIRA